MVSKICFDQGNPYSINMLDTEESALIYIEYF